MTKDISGFFNPDRRLGDGESSSRDIEREDRRKDYIANLKGIYPEDYLIRNNFCTKEEYDAAPTSNEYSHLRRK